MASAICPINGMRLCLTPRTQIKIIHLYNSGHCACHFWYNLSDIAQHITSVNIGKSPEYLPYTVKFGLTSANIIQLPHHLPLPVWFFIHHNNCVYKITAHTNTNTPKGCKLLSRTFSSELRKPCCWCGKRLSPANTKLFLRTYRTLVQLLQKLPSFSMFET